GDHSAVLIAGPDTRHDHIVDHPTGDSVGNHTLQSVAHLKPQLPIRRHHEESKPVIDAFSPDLPLGKRSHGPVLYWRVACCLTDIDEELVTGRMLILLEVGVQ